MQQTFSPITRQFYGVKTEKRLKLLSFFFFWKSLQSCKDSFSQGCYKLIRSGRNTEAWTDPWIPYNGGFKPLPASESIIRDNSLLVKDLMVDNNWDLNLITNLSNTDTINNILKIYPYNRLEDDRYIEAKK